MMRSLHHMVRFEILLPLYYNNGNQIEQDKFLETNQELVTQFGATSTDSVIVSGKWMYHGIIYDDRLIRIHMDTDDSPAHRNFLSKYKQILKERFQQEDIWITVQYIDVI